MKNFGKIKNIFNTILAEAITDKDETKKSLFKSYIKILKENKILKTQFDIYTKIEKMVEGNQFKAEKKINRIIESIREFEHKAIIEANKKLAELIIDKEIEDYKSEELHENISNLIFSVDVDTYVDSLYETIEYTKKNTIKEEVKGNGVPNELLAKLAVDKFNDAYTELDENTKKAVKVIVEGNDETKESLFNNTIKECISLINDKLKDSDVDIKESLLAAKENLLDRTYSNDTFENDIAKMLNLKNDLNK
jgi:hypothetical protein